MNTLQRKKYYWLILALLLPLQLIAQSITVTGTVSDETGESLPGVNIIEDGTTNGTITDINGRFSLLVSSQSRLIFSFVGYQNQRIDVRGQRVINVVMRVDNALLNEVVVVGYGQMRRSDLTGAVSSVSAEAISKSVVTSVDQVLQGRAAGVQVMQNSGIPGGSTSIRIRGINSLNASNEPIFVIDGVVIDGSTGSSSSNALSSINPADVVSIDVLKDASATAIYGSRAANGVIIITTNRGQEGVARVSYDGYVGTQMMPKKLRLLNLQEFAYHKNERTSIMGFPMDHSFVRPDLLGAGTDWQDELFGVAITTNHNLNISGGKDKTLYSLGVGLLDQDGIALGSGFKRLNLRGSFDTEVKKWLRTGVNFSIVNSKQNITVDDNDLIITAMMQTPNVAARNIDGTYGGPETDEFVQSNPVGLALLKENRNERVTARSNVYLDFILSKTLNFKTEFSSDIGMNNDYRFTPSFQFGAIVNENRESLRAKAFSQYWAWRNILSYNNTFDIVHNVNAMLGYEMQNSVWEYLSGFRDGFITNNARDLNAGSSDRAGNTGSSGGNALISSFGRLFYSYDSKYLLTATMRYDGSSKFARGNRWGWFPSAALAWRVSSEEFMADIDQFSNLKLRLGWGKVGNQNIPDYAYTSTMAAVPTPWGTGLLSGNTANPDLKWESTSSSNVGLDVSFFNNRVNLVLDLYHKKTDNLLLQLPLPAYVGTIGQGSTTPPWVNIGSLQNRGVELAVNTENVRNRDFSWRSNLVFSRNRNKVLSLDTETSVLDMTLTRGAETSIITRTSVGQPIGQFFGYQVIGRFETATDFYYRDANGNIRETPRPEGQPISQNGVWIGDLIFRDVNGDGVINDADRTYIGNPEPKFSYGIGNTFTYKNFDLSINLNGSYGNDVYNWIRRWMDNPRQTHNVSIRATEFARLVFIDPTLPAGNDQGQINNIRNITLAPNSHPNMPRLSSADANSNYRVSNRFVEDGSYLRIQNISFSYSLPKQLLRQVDIENLRIYANLQNVYTFSKYKGYDPEIGAIRQNALLTGIDNGRYPSPKIYTIGLNITF